MSSQIIIVGLVAAFAAALLRALREDVKFFPTLAQPWRGILVAVLALVVTPCLDQYLNNGTPLWQSLVAAALAAAPTIFNLLMSALAGVSNSGQVCKRVSGSATFLLVLGIAVLAVPSASACALFGSQAAIVSQLATWDGDIRDAREWLATEKALIDAVVQGAASEQTRTKVQAAYAAAVDALDAGETTIAGMRSATDQDYVAAFTNFAFAYQNLMDAIAQLKSVGMMARPAPKLVQRVNASDQGVAR
jgi:hypothetical protein